MKQTIFGFCKMRNEVLRGNIYRCLAELERFCDGGVLCDDASTDGTAEILREWAKTHKGWALMEVPADQQAFEKEMQVKQQMMRGLHSRKGEPPTWILWLDADEAMSVDAGSLRTWLYYLPEDVPGVRCHYTQLWRNSEWARTDQGFDEGEFVKFWRYRGDLSFDVTSGTHRNQYPVQIAFDACKIAPFEVMHYGNVGKNLVWKAIMYSGGRGGVDRHISFGHPPEDSMATGEGFDQKEWSSEHPTYRHVPATLPFGCHNCGEPLELYYEERGGWRWRHAEPYTSRAARRPGLPTCMVCPVGPLPPAPFTLDEIKIIRSMGSLKNLSGWFTVVVPAFNRGKDLPYALDSLLAQTYSKWIAVVPDDGSTDDTPRVMREYEEKDPRIFSARYLKNRGGVAMNEIGMALACEFTEFWTRLGSDDWFARDKLQRDAIALQEHEAVFGPFRVCRQGILAETCNEHFDPRSDRPATPEEIREHLLARRFFPGWANVACRTSVLRRVRGKFGSFVDPRMRNMEDFLFNARVSALGVPWHFRPGGLGYWNDMTGTNDKVSASANADRTNHDNALTIACYPTEWA